MKEEGLKIKSGLGLNIAAIKNTPEISNGKLAILCPGYLDTKDYFHLKDIAKQLALQGYTVYRFDPIGTWYSEGDVSLYSNSQYLNDVKSVLDFATLDNSFSEILLGGHSRGGQISLLYALVDSRINKVLAIMPSSGINTSDLNSPRYIAWKQEGFSISKRDLPENSNEFKEYKIAYDHVLDMLQYKLMSHVSELKIPKLFVLGELDVMCTPEDVEELFNLANEPKKLLRLSGVGHDYRKSSDCSEINKLILENLNNI